MHVYKNKSSCLITVFEILVQYCFVKDSSANTQHCTFQHERLAFGPSCTEFFYPEYWHFDDDATSKIDDVLTEHGGLLHVLPLAVHPEFFLLDK